MCTCGRKSLQLWQPGSSHLTSTSLFCVWFNKLHGNTGPAQLTWSSLTSLLTTLSLSWVWCKPPSPHHLLWFLHPCSELGAASLGRASGRGDWSLWVKEWGTNLCYYRSPPLEDYSSSRTKWLVADFCIQQESDILHVPNFFFLVLGQLTQCIDDCIIPDISWQLSVRTHSSILPDP